VEGDETTMLAQTHARRWIHPVPLDEKQLAVERERERREREREMARERREALARARSRKEEIDPEVLVPVKRPLPPAARVVAGDDVMLADLQGHTLRRAVVYLGGVGLVPRVELDPDGPDEGVVVAQDPPAGALLRRGDVVRLRPGRLLPAPPVTEEGDVMAAGVRDEAAAGGRVAPARRALH
jgi:hypothetical protein